MYKIIGIVFMLVGIVVAVFSFVNMIKAPYLAISFCGGVVMVAVGLFLITYREFSS